MEEVSKNSRNGAIRERPVLIVIDTLEKFRPAAKTNAAAYSTDYLAISGLHKLAHAREIAIVVIHHVRKMDAEDPFDMVSGTNGLTGAADTILVLRRQAGSVTLHARGRDIEEKETPVGSTSFLPLDAARRCWRGP
jgi:RecA-family ATPase